MKTSNYRSNTTNIKPSTQSAFALQNAVPMAPISTILPTTETDINNPSVNIELLSSFRESKLQKSAHMNLALWKTMDFVVDSFVDKKRTAEDDLKDRLEEQKNDDMLAVIGDQEIINKETYGELKKELKVLTKELNTKENFLNQQKSVAQKVLHQARVLKTQVQDPLEVSKFSYIRSKHNTRIKLPINKKNLDKHKYFLINIRNYIVMKLLREN